MQTELIAKRNQDGSHSIAMDAQTLVQLAWVDFYDDRTGDGYQRNERTRESRARAIEEYFAGCSRAGLKPRLFELTANIRSKADSASATVSEIDEEGRFGFLTVESEGHPWLAIIDGATRLRGIERALAAGVLDGSVLFDIRVFDGLTTAEEIALFLLVNEKQKRVRTDLSRRVVQRRIDEGELNDHELATLKTVVPEDENWKFESTRIAGILNGDASSPWYGRIQMPNDNITKPIKLQAFATSLRPLLENQDIGLHLNKLIADGDVTGFSDTTALIVRILKNFWRAVRTRNPQAFAEPNTNVLWGSIGVNGCHAALGAVLSTIISGSTVNFREANFSQMLDGSCVADYLYWFSRPGRGEAAEYPGDKGEATTMTGGSGYKRLGKILEGEWRAALHAAQPVKAVQI